MWTFKPVRGVVVAACVATGALLIIANGAMASGTKVCISEKEGGSVKTPKGGVCPKKYKLTELGEPSTLSTAEQEELKEIRKYVKVIPSGIDGKPTVQVSGANVQILSGAPGNQEREVNGEGNLIVGYDESARTQTGSNNLIIGSEQEYVSFGGFLGGLNNAVRGEFDSVAGGFANNASGDESSVSGGGENDATGRLASVSGGFSNRAESGEDASASGGEDNIASGEGASVSGGSGNTASGRDSSVSGESDKTASKFVEWLP